MFFYLFYLVYTQVRDNASSRWVSIKKSLYFKKQKKTTSVDDTWPVLNNYMKDNNRKNLRMDFYLNIKNNENYKN